MADTCAGPSDAGTARGLVLQHRAGGLERGFGGARRTNITHGKFITNGFFWTGSGNPTAPPRYADPVSSASRLSTRVLLVCAAIGVGTGILGGAAGWLTLAVLATAPWAYGLVLGSHVLPGIIAQQVVEEVRDFFEGKVFETMIPRTVRLSEAPSFGQPITQYDPSGKGARSYRWLAEEVVSRV